MRSRKRDRNVVSVENEGFIAAGRVIPFPAQSAATLTALTREEEALADRGLIKTMTIVGDSLEGVGIYNGDEVIVKKICDKKDITRKTVCVVYIPSTGEVCGKRVRFARGAVTLESCNPDVPPMYFHPDEIEIRGTIIALHRTPNIDGRFDRGYEDREIPF